jgi:hypothetical protein
VGFTCVKDPLVPFTLRFDKFVGVVYPASGDKVTVTVFPPLAAPLFGDKLEDES